MALNNLDAESDYRTSELKGFRFEKDAKKGAVRSSKNIKPETRSNTCSGPEKRLNFCLSRGVSMCGAAICPVRGSRNACARKKAIGDYDGPSLCYEPALIACLRRIIPRPPLAYLAPFRVALKMHTPLPDSGGIESLWVSAVPLFRKAPSPDPTSVGHARSTIRETRGSRGCASRIRTRGAISPGPFGG